MSLIVALLLLSAPPDPVRRSPFIRTENRVLAPAPQDGRPVPRKKRR